MLKSNKMWIYIIKKNKVPKFTLKIVSYKMPEWEGVFSYFNNLWVSAFHESLR